MAYLISRNFILTFKDNNHNHHFGKRRLKTQSIKNGICGVASINEKVFESSIGNSTESTNYGKCLFKKNHFPCLAQCTMEMKNYEGSCVKFLSSTAIGLSFKQIICLDSWSALFFGYRYMRHKTTSFSLQHLVYRAKFQWRCNFTWNSFF